LILLLALAIQTETVQNWLVGMATSRLSKSLGTEVSVKKVSIGLFNRLNMEGTLVRDQHKDTLLYAGQVKVRITDWFFLRDKAVLKYIGLEDVVVQLHRKDSTWNYQYLADHFASSDTTPKKKGGMILDLKKLDLKNIRFRQDDRWVGERMDIGIASLVTDVHAFDLKKGHFDLGEVLLDKPLFATQGYKPLRPDSLRRKNNGADTGMYFNPGNLSILAKKITITNGQLRIDGNETKPVAHFDGSHIQLSKLNGTLSSVSFVKDTLRADINLSVKDRSGFELKKLKTNFRLTPQIMELASLDLQTNKSRLGTYYAMKFRDFNKDFGEYIDQVIMDARFREVKVSTDDIAYFAPELKDIHKTITLSGNYLGTVANFTVTGLSARLGTRTNISGTFSMKGLPNIASTQILFSNGTVVTNYNDFGSLIPEVRGITAPNIAALGNLIYRGNFKGTVNNFVTRGTFSTELGGVVTDISLRLPRRGDPVYDGSIETNHFNIGKFLNTESLGYVDFKGRITGSSFNIDRLKTSLDGRISSLEFNDYTYQNIVTNGTFQKKAFSGEVKIDDPNLSFTTSVELDLSTDVPRYNAVGDLVKSNLKALGFIKEPIELTGLLDANFTGTDIDNFLGSAKFLNATVRNESTRLNFDSLNLTSSYTDSTKILTLGSNDFNASIIGRFSILDLPASFQSFLHRYYPAYIAEPKYIPQNQHFTINAGAGYIEPYLKIFSKNFSGFNDATLSGTVDTRNHDFRITTRVPFGKIDKYAFTGVDLQGRGNLDSLSLRGEITSINMGDSLRFPNTRLSVVARGDHSVVSIQTSADNTFNDAYLNADVYSLQDGVRIQFRPSSFVLNSKKWNLEKQGELVIRKNFLLAQNVKFTQGLQEIIASTEEEDGGNTNNLVVKLRNVILGDITSLFMKDPRLEGLTSGTIVMRDFFGQFKADADLKAEQFRMDDDSIGLVKIKSGYDSKTGLIPFTVESLNENYQFNAKGSYNLKDSTGNPLNTELDLADMRINFLEKFLNTLFTDLKGQAEGKLRISGDPSSPNLIGRVKLRNAGMKVNYTQVYYTIDSADIRFEEDGIDFGSFTIRDELKRPGTVKGKLYERGFRDMAFDFELSTNKLLLIDTKPQDNQQFYGKAVGSATLTLKGPEYAARMNLEARSNDSSHIFIPNSVSRESATADFIEFKQYGTEMTDNTNRSSFNLTVDLDITANNLAQIDVILDEASGDVIKATGNGRLKIRAGTTEPLTINGQYNIEKGNYDFNFQSFIRKPFVLIPNAGSFIKWTGDPFKADIHIDAQYTAERVALYDLISNLEMSGAVKGYRGEVFVIAELRDKLTKPTIKFRLDFPQGSPVKSDNVMMQYLNRLERDENEILKQVSFLIVFNSFAPPSVGNGGGTANNSLATIGVNTLSQILTKEINKLFSNFLYKLTGNKSLQFDLGTSIYSNSEVLGAGAGNASSFDRSRINFKLGKSFFQDKIFVTFGGDLDFNLSNSSAVKNGNFQWLPDLNIEFILSKDRKLRAIIFNKNSLDISGSSFGRRNRFGVSISYRKDFERLFGTKEDEITFKPTPVADSTRK
jgi:hypothetical protein